MTTVGSMGGGAVYGMTATEQQETRKKAAEYEITHHCTPSPARATNRQASHHPKNHKSKGELP